MKYMSKYGIDYPLSYLQNNFNYGESGDKLSVNKESDYYKATANTIINMVTTEIGNLKLLKKPIVKSSDIAFSDVQQIINTKHNFYIVITKTKILTLNKTTYKKIGQIDNINFDRKKNRATLIENFLLLTQADGTRIDYEINDAGAIGVNTNFVTSLRKPVKDKSKITVDIYQVRKINIGTGVKTRAYKLSKTELQEFKVDGTSLKFKYDDTLKITRIYYPYQAELVTIEGIPNLKENDYFISINSFETFDSGKFYLGNAELELTGKKSDVSGSFFETVSVTGDIGKTGLITYGTIFKDFDKFITSAEYQNRLIVSDGEYIYFSRVGDYNYFLNGENSDDAFYIKLSTINGERTEILRLVADRGLWVITNKGVFLVGYNQIIKGSDIEVRFIGTDKCTMECCTVNNALFYLTEENKIKSVQNTTGVKGYIDFQINKVDKFTDSFGINILEEYYIDNTKTLFVGLKENPTNSFGALIGAYIFKAENINVFSRTSLEVPLNVIPLYDMLFLDSDNILEPGTNNVEKAYITLNAPPASSKQSGFLLNDASSEYRKVACKLYTPSIDDVKGLTVNDINSNQIGDNSQGIYSLYSFNLGGILLLDKINITIVTSQSKNEVELQATETFYSVGTY